MSKIEQTKDVPIEETTKVEEEEEISIEEIFIKFKTFNIDIGLVCNNQYIININPFNNNYVQILTDLLDDSCELIDISDKEIILDNMLEIYDELDTKGFKGGQFQMIMQESSQVVNNFISKLN